nr:bactericidal permeability-increasing protein [Zonotrichia albicollis]
MGMQSVAVACGALTLCLALTTATNPGFVVRITQAGLDYAQQQAIASLEKKLAQLRLPDISGDSRVLRVGKVHYELSRLRLRDFHLPYSRITPISNKGLQVSISNAFAELDGDWRVKFLFIRDHGSFDLKVENIYIKILLRLGSDTSGKPTISTPDCSAHISKVRVLFSGKLGWLYNLFHSVIESRLRKILENKVCDKVAMSVYNELQTYIRTLPVTARIDNKIGIDYSLVAPPRATTKSLDADLKVCDNVAKSVQNELQKQVRTLPVTARIDNKIGIDYSLVAPPRATTKSLDLDLKVSISNAFAELNGDWRVKFLFIKAHGSLNVKVQNVNMKIILKLGSDTTGRPTISTSGCSATISNVRPWGSVVGKTQWHKEEILHREKLVNVVAGPDAYRDLSVLKFLLV